MVNRKHLGLLVCILSVSLATPAWAEIPDLDLSFVESASLVQVSVNSLPNAGGQGLNDVYAFGGATTDATVTLTLLDAVMNPFVNYPAEDLWIDTDTGTFVFCCCHFGTIADANTDINGQTTFTHPMFAGASGEGLIIRVSGDALSQAPLDFLFNSPDINGDLLVNLTDVVLFSQNFFGPYNYNSDFFWDGVLNLSDIVLLAQGMGAQCP